jgi:hypothetical protein
VWLGELSRKYNSSLNLATVPAEEWDAIAALGFDAVWLMGVWQRSPVGAAIAAGNDGLPDAFHRALPDFSESDNVGSPYCIRRYEVDDELGGPGALAAARTMLAERGLCLVLDFVPNHVSPDHSWVTEHPEYFIQGHSDDHARSPDEFFNTGTSILAHGRDPYFPPWPDVVQLNAFNPGLRKAAIETVSTIVEQCDGIRCDMAMLMMNLIFDRTWGARAGPKPEKEYWAELIASVRERHPHALFIAEAYWNLEWELQQQGFDYCYDKRLYDRLEHDHAEQVRLHLRADLNYQQRLLRFIENHDEPRAAAIFGEGKARAAAVTFATLPGAKLFHEGQLEGRHVRIPVFLRRRPEEIPNLHLQLFYRNLLQALRSAAFREGEWQLCEQKGWPDNDSYRNLIAWCWRATGPRCLIVVNLSATRSRGRVLLPWPDIARSAWRLQDVFSGEVFQRDGAELGNVGLFVDLLPWGFHFLSFET